MTPNKTVPAITSDSRLSKATRNVMVDLWAIEDGITTGRRALRPEEWHAITDNSADFIFTGNPDQGALSAPISSLFLVDDCAHHWIPAGWARYQGRYLYNFNFYPQLLGSFPFADVGDKLYVSSYPVSIDDKRDAAAARFFMAYVALVEISQRESVSDRELTYAGFSLQELIDAGLTISSDGRFVNEASVWIQCRVLEVTPRKDDVDVLAEVESVRVIATAWPNPTNDGEENIA